MATKKKLPIKKSVKKTVAAKAKPPAAKKLPQKSAKLAAKVTPPKPAVKAPLVASKKVLAQAKGNKPTANATELKRMMLERKVAPKAIAFSLDEVREIAKKNEHQIESTAKTGKSTKSSETAKQAANTGTLNHPAKPHKPNHVKAASLADILGFNPKKGKPRAAMIDEKMRFSVRRLLIRRGALQFFHLRAKERVRIKTVQRHPLGDLRLQKKIDELRGQLGLA